MSKNVLFKNKPAIVDWPIKKERKQDCIHLDHNQLTPLPFKII